MAAGPAPVIIVKKRKASHGGHHGGAWKVAYADFVTAMMAFFLVLWLVGQNQDVKSAVAGYFTDPGVFAHQTSTAPIAGGEGVLDARIEQRTKDDLVSAQVTLERAADRIREQLRALPGFSHLEDQIEIQMTPEGLRIELQEGRKETFFDPGSAAVKPETEQVLSVIAKELAQVRQAVAIEGHTDSQPFGRARTYTNWELSADRANAARRVMEAAGLPLGHIQGIRGFADTIPRTPDDRFNPRNRRVSIVVQHQSLDRGPA